MLNNGNLSVENFGKICRTCLTEEEISGKMKFLYEMCPKEVSLTEMLMSITFVRFSEKDELPSQICVNCESELTKAYRFAQNCSEVDKTLRKCFNEFKKLNDDIKFKTTTEEQTPESAEVQIKAEIEVEEHTIDINPECFSFKHEILSENENSCKTNENLPENTIINNENLVQNEINDSCDSDFLHEHIDDKTHKTNEEDSKQSAIKSKQNTPEIEAGPPYECKACLATFQTYTLLRQHWKELKHQENCKICSKSITSFYMNQHLKSHSGEKPFCCEVCGKAFIAKNKFKQHLMSHTGEKPHKCNVCGKGFLYPTVLKEHMRIHNGEKPFVCDYCGKQWRVKKHLDQHKKIHTGEKPHKCTICDKAFTQAATLKIHLRTHTGERPFICDHCGKSFTTNGLLKLHLINHDTGTCAGFKLEIKKRTKNWFCNRPLSPVDTAKEDSKGPTLENYLQDVVNSDKLMPLDSNNYCDDETVQSSVGTPCYDSDKDLEFSADSENDGQTNCDPLLLIDTNRESEFPSDSEDELLLVRKTIDIKSETRNALRKTSCTNIEFVDLQPKSENSNSQSKRKRQRDFCIFCNTCVSNFARHIFRNHALETEVQRILALPVKSIERKQALTLLRNKGNFLINSENSEICRRPVKKHNLSKTKFLPCEYCLGYYSRKHLWRHRKTCIANLNKMPTHQAHAQNYLVKHLNIDNNLRDKVFPRMRADDISLIVKKDPLICAFGARYLKMHPKKDFINVTSRKMRELAKLLIELKKIEPAIQNLFIALQPKYFDYIVTATKLVAKYDVVNETFDSPNYAVNIATSLKQCCNIAITYALEKHDIYANMQPSEAQSDLNTMKQLLSSHWKFGISRLPSDVYQTEKNSKLLLLMEQGTAAAYTGQTLDNIEIKLEENLWPENRAESDDVGDELCDYNENMNEDLNIPESSNKNDMNFEMWKMIYPVAKPNTSTNLEMAKITKHIMQTNAKTKKRHLIPWTDEQKNIVNKYFEKHIRTNKAPKKGECEKLIEQYPDVLQNKSWLKIKVYVQNKYTKKLK